MSMGVLGIGATDDSLYMVGGECDTSVKKYDVDQDRWITVTNMTSARGDTGVAVLDGKLYVSGGRNKIRGDNSYMKTIECYDISTDTWTKVADMNKARAGHDLFVLNGSLLDVGGDEEGETIEEYNVARDTWTVKEENLVHDVDGAFVMMKYFLEQDDVTDKEDITDNKDVTDNDDVTANDDA